MQTLSLSAASVVVEGGDFGQISEVSVGPTGRIAIRDAVQNGVALIDPAHAGDLRWLPRGQGPGEVSLPTGIDWLEDGTLVVLDAGNLRLNHFAVSGDSIIYLRDWKLQVPSYGLCAEPTEVVVGGASGEHMIRQIDLESGSIRGVVPIRGESWFERELIAGGRIACTSGLGGASVPTSFSEVTEWTMTGGSRVWDIEPFDGTIYQLEEDGRTMTPTDGEDGTSDYVRGLSYGPSGLLWVSIGKTQRDTTVVRVYRDAREVAAFGSSQNFGMLDVSQERAWVSLETPTGPSLVWIPAPEIEEVRE
jgi:hypothetical protein